MATVSRIQTMVTSLLSSPTVLDGTQLKEVSSFNYEDHKCEVIIQGSKYYYAHGKNNTVDILNAQDLSYVTTLDIDGGAL